jgi:hypothetical protein
MHSNAAQTVDISVELDEEIVGGIKAVGDSDAMRKLEGAMHTANHGAAVRPQRSTSHTKPTKSREINQQHLFLLLRWHES